MDKDVAGRGLCLIQNRVRKQGLSCKWKEMKDQVELMDNWNSYNYNKFSF